MRARPLMGSGDDCPCPRPGAGDGRTGGKVILSRKTVTVVTSGRVPSHTDMQKSLIIYLKIRYISLNNII